MPETPRPKKPLSTAVQLTRAAPSKEIKKPLAEKGGGQDLFRRRPAADKLSHIFTCYSTPNCFFYFDPSIKIMARRPGGLGDAEGTAAGFPGGVFFLAYGRLPSGAA